MIKNCVYFCEGPCDVALINALRKEPSLIVSGRPREFNVIQNQITNSMLLTIKPGTTVVFVFDTDKEITDKLKRSIELIKTRCPKTKIVFLMQVKNLEDALVRSTDLKKVTDLTQSESLSNFLKWHFVELQICVIYWNDIKLMSKGFGQQILPRSLLLFRVIANL